MSQLQKTLATSSRPLRQRHPHAHDSNVKTWDYAYENGLGANSGSVLDSIWAGLQVIIAGTASHALLLQSVALIFFGCCTNVYTLESILVLSSATGTLITAVQFVMIALFHLPSQLTFTTVSPPDPSPLQPTQDHWLPRFKARKVPLQEWMLYALQFVVINTLNNAAFGYKISLPLHIILRSAGPVASMLVSRVWTGKRYSVQKIIAVALLFVGVVSAALSDAGGTVPAISESMSNTTLHTLEEKIVEELQVPERSIFSQQLPGFLLLSLALLLSATMGIWCDKLYAKYGRQGGIAEEQLFYSHLLALPFFLAQWTGLQIQFKSLIDAADQTGITDTNMTASSSMMSKYSPVHFSRLYQSLPQALPLLLGNAVTQIFCISGVHHLSTQTSALTVSIVLNVRKLASLLLSIYLFGNRLSPGVVIGAILVFLGGGLYAMPESKAGVKDVADRKKTQ